MLIIVEAGLAWNNFDEAIQYCDVAKEIKADIVKFQIVENKELPQLTFGEWKVIKNHCDKIGIEFMATPSSERIVDFLYDIGVKKCKIGSDRAINFNFTCYVEARFKDVIISNGYGSKGNMYCVSLYPCSEKYIDWNEAKKFEGFSDHTQIINTEWTTLIKDCNFKYYEKHLSLGYNDIDSNVSLNKNEFKILVERLK